MYYQLSIATLFADVTAANIPDYQVYPEMTSSSKGLPPEFIKKHFVVANPSYDDPSWYNSSFKMGFQLVRLVRNYRKTPKERRKLVDFNESSVGQVVYSKRGISIEPLVDHI